MVHNRYYSLDPMEYFHFNRLYSQVVNVDVSTLPHMHTPTQGAGEPSLRAEFKPSRASL